MIKIDFCFLTIFFVLTSASDELGTSGRRDVIGATAELRVLAVAAFTVRTEGRRYVVRTARKVGGSATSETVRSVSRMKFVRTTSES